MIRVFSGGLSYSRQWGRAAVVSTVGLLFTTLLFVMMVRQSRVAQHEDFLIRTAAASEDLRRGFGMPVEILRSLRAFFDASELVTRHEFSEFVEDALARYPAIRLLEWAPVVTDAERAEFEAEARREYPDFEITEASADASFVRAQVRPLYAPLRFIEPADDLTALGFDLMGESSRRARVYRAAESAEPLATERFQLAEDPDGNGAIAVYFPVYAGESVPTDPQQRRQSLQGLAIAIFRFNLLVETAFEELGENNLAVSLLDVSHAENPVVLFEYNWDPSYEQKPSARDRTVNWHFAGRDWVIRYHDTTPPQTPWYVWTVLLIGLIVTFLVTATVVRSDEITKLKRQVAEARRLGQYTLSRRIGEGGMGTVYSAHHTFLRRPTAIKVLRKTTDEQSVIRFEREVQLTAKLTHPNTVAIYDFGRTDHGEFYYAMEYLDGLTWEQLIRVDGPIRSARLIYLMIQALDALEEAHLAGLIHRDLKPGNLMVTRRGTIPDFVKVLDFGLVKELSPAEDLSPTRTVLGTPQYLAPESINPEAEVDTRADLYSLGVVMYFMLTGEPVFTARTLAGLCYQHLSEKPVPVSARTVQPIAADIEAVIMKALAKRPEDRFQTASEFANALKACSDAAGWSRQAATEWWDEFEHRRPTIEGMDSTSPMLTPMTINVSQALNMETSSDDR